MAELRQKFSEHWSTDKKVIGAHVDPPTQNFFFSADYISAPGGAAPQQGRSDGGYIGIYTPKSVYLKFVYVVVFSS